MSSRNPTLREINEILIPRISAHYKKIGQQHRHNEKLGALLSERYIISDVIPELTQLLFDSSGREPEHLLKVTLEYLNTLNQRDVGIALDIQRKISEPLSVRQRVIEATTLFMQEYHGDQLDAEWQDALDISEYDVMEIIPYLLQNLGPEHQFYADLYHLYTEFNDDFLSLVAHIDFWIDNQVEFITDPELLVVLTELRTLVKERRGPIAENIQQRKLLRLIDSEGIMPHVRSVLVKSEPSPTIQIGRLVEFLNMQQTTDVPLWLIQLLSGKVSALIEVRKMYDHLREKVGDNPSFTIVGYLDGSLVIPQDLTEDIKKFDDYLDDDQDGRLSVVEIVQNYITSIGNHHPENFDKSALVHVLETFFDEDHVEANDQLTSIRGVLSSQKIINNDLEGFLENYLENRPRKLTREEINGVLESVPLPIGDADISSSIWSAMTYKLGKQIMIHEITPLAIPELKELIRRQAYSARVSANTTVGTQAAAAIGATTTQMTLNAFHSSGSALNMSSGIERMKQLIKFSKDIKKKKHDRTKVKTSCSVYFEPRVPFNIARTAIMNDDWETMKSIGWNFEEIINQRKSLVGLMVKDLLLEDPQIDPSTSILSDEPWWYDIHRLSYGVPTPNSNWVLRLKLDPVALYKYRVTVEDVINAITSGTWRERSAMNKVHGIDLVWSPDNVGIEEQGMTVPVIDIYPKESELQEVLKNVDLTQMQNAYMFLSKVIKPSFSGIKVKGVEGVFEAFPAAIKVWNTVENVSLIEDRTWDIRVKQRSAVLQGVNNLFIARLCRVAGLEIIHIYDDLMTVRVRVPENLSNDPKKIVTGVISDDEEEAVDHQEAKLREKQIPSRRSQTAVSISSSHYFIETLGANLIEVMNVPQVDQTRTHSNFHKEDFTVLGIEGARNRLVIELFKVLAKKGTLPINPRHIMLLADSMCRTGEVLPLNFPSLPLQGQGFLTRSAFEQPSLVVSKAAIIGETEIIGEPGVNGGISAAIFLGKEARIGAGAIDIKVDRDKLRTFTQDAGGMVYDETAFAEIVKNHRLSNHVEDMVTGMDDDMEDEGGFETFTDTTPAPASDKMLEKYKASPAVISAAIPRPNELSKALGSGNLRGAEQRSVAEKLSSTSCMLPPGIPGLRR